MLKINHIEFWKCLKILNNLMVADFLMSVPFSYDLPVFCFNDAKTVFFCFLFQYERLMTSVEVIESHYIVGANNTISDS